MSEANFEIENRVAKSPLITIDLDDYLDSEVAVFFDLRPFLFQEMVLREKDFRQAMKEHDWQQYADKVVVVGCSVDAIVPTWAYMLVTSKLSPVALDVRQGTEADQEKYTIDAAIAKVAQQNFEGQKVVIKGCGGVGARDYAYTEITKLLVPVVSSLMYGEPCSTVPIYKQPRKRA
ncbi:MAG: DUF2480 family protein [Bacteroidota bacterium]